MQTMRFHSSFRLLTDCNLLIVGLIICLIAGAVRLSSCSVSDSSCSVSDSSCEGVIVSQEEEAVEMARGLMGAPKAVSGAENDVEIDDIAKFAVQEHNTKEGKNLAFKKVVKASKQVVSGTMYHLTLEVTPEAEGQPKLYDVKVWTKPWESHKTLEHFKETETSSSA